MWNDASVNEDNKRVENGARIETAGSVVKNNGTISIPGYQELLLKADSRDQDLTLFNPPENNCFFQIELMLDDGTLLWQSDLIEPGYSSLPIKLVKPLEEGSYTGSVLKYSCYSMEDSSKQLNGAETIVTLRVK